MNTPHELIDAFLEDSLDAVQNERLSEWLRADPANLQMFTDALLFEQQIREAIQSERMRDGAALFASLGVDQMQVGGSLPNRTSRLRWAALAASVAILLGVFAWRTLPQTPTAGPSVAWVGEVTGLRRAVVVGGDPWRAGQRLMPGRVALAAGAMELALSNGVRIIFEGPGELELLSPMRAVLHSGQAVVSVSEGGKGFRLETTSAQLVDLGTEFGVKCGPGGITDVLVFDGEVLASAAGASGFPQQLKAGQGTRFSRVEPLREEIAYRPERFVRRLPVDKGIPIENNDFPFNVASVEEIVVYAAKQPIAVDGDLSEWPADGLFRSGAASQERSVEGRMCYDSECLYVAAHIRDPFPLRNVVDPGSDGELGWRGGGLQIRVAADPALGWPVNANAAEYYQSRQLPVDALQLSSATHPALAHLTLWQYAGTGQPCLHVAYGMDYHGGTTNPAGFRGAFRQDADARGYQLEYAIPWRLLHAPRVPESGQTLAMSWTAHWSDESGRLWRGQLVELRNAAEPYRIHTWERAATWGRAIFR